VKQVLTRQLLSQLLRGSIAAIIIADHLPVVASIAHPVVAEARHFLTRAQRRFEVTVRVQVLASLVVLDAHLVATFQASTRLAGSVQSLSIAQNPQRVLVLFLLHGRYHLLARATPVVGVH